MPDALQTGMQFRWRTLIDVIQMHEKARPDFSGDDYTEDQWNAITGLVVRVGR